LPFSARNTRGEVLVVFTRQTLSGLQFARARLLDANGAPLAPETQWGDGLAQGVAFTGRAFVAIAHHSLPVDEHYAQVLDLKGRPVGSPLSLGLLESPMLRRDPAGGALLVTAGESISLLRFDDDGRPRGTLQTLIPQAGFSPDAGADLQGNVVVSWIDEDRQVSFRRYSPLLAPLGEIQLVAPGLNGQARVAVGGDGTFAVFYRDFSMRIFGHAYGAGGRSIAAAALLAQASSLGDRGLAPAANADGRWLLIWGDFDSTAGASLIRGRFLTARGRAQGTPFKVAQIAQAAGAVADPSLARTGPGSFLAFWSRLEAGGRPRIVVGRRLAGEPDQVIPFGGARASAVKAGRFRSLLSSRRREQTLTFGGPQPVPVLGNVDGR
jgi:hypothetical protein